MGEKIFRFKIILNNILPQIWRDIEVEDDITFYQFHLMIQEAMGWTNSHLHEFSNENIRIGDTNEETCELGNLPEWEERDQKIDEYFSEDQTTLNYIYDFGDNWEHTILLEAIEPKRKGIKYPRCIDGARACPPEDCDSSPGYYRLLKILSDSKHEEYEEMKEWAGDYHPEYFDKKEATAGMRDVLDLNKDDVEFPKDDDSSHGRGWDNMSGEMKEIILNNVWCPQCKKAVTMLDYAKVTEKGMEILKGKCANCAHKVVRVLE